MRLFSLFLFLFLCCFTPSNIYAQKISIHPDIFKNAHKSLLILSDDQGKVYEAEVIDSAEVTAVRTLFFKHKNQKQKIHFTLLNEFSCSNSLGKTFYYNRVYTFYDMPDSIFIEQLPFVAEEKRRPLKTSFLMIDGINSVEQVTALSPHSYMKDRFDKNTNTLQIQYKSEWDPFIVLKCNGEEKTRWLHIENPKMEEALIEFETLPNEIKVKEITFPEKEEWGVAVKSTRSDGSGRIQLNNRLDAVKRNKCTVLLPESSEYQSFRIEIGRSIDKKQSAVLFYDWNLEETDRMPKINLSDFKYKLTSNSNGFVLKGRGVQYQSHVLYISKKVYCTSSGWKIAGASLSEMNFTFPDVSKQIRAQMDSPFGADTYSPLNIQIVQELDNGNRVIVESVIN